MTESLSTPFRPLLLLTIVRTILPVENIVSIVYHDPSPDPRSLGGVWTTSLLFHPDPNEQRCTTGGPGPLEGFHQLPPAKAGRPPPPGNGTGRPTTARVHPAPARERSSRSAVGRCSSHRRPSTIAAPVTAGASPSPANSCGGTPSGPCTVEAGYPMGHTRQRIVKEAGIRSRDASSRSPPLPRGSPIPSEISSEIPFFGHEQRDNARERSVRVGEPPAKRTRCTSASFAGGHPRYLTLPP